MFSSLGRLRWLSAALAVTAIVAYAGAAHAIGERIVDIRVSGAQRTDESTIRSIAGLRIGDTMENETLALVRERLNTTGLFADVNVYWEAYGEGVRVNIAVKDKFPWAPVPTGSWSANNKSIGLVFVHGNLFGWGKQLAVGGRLAELDSGALLAYRDPALFGTWMYWELKGVYQRQIIPEFDPSVLSPSAPIRQTTFDAYGVEPAFGVAWFRRVKTQVSWRFDRVDYKGTAYPDPVTGVVNVPPPYGGPPTSKGGHVAVGRAAVAFDWRAREQAIMTGPALGGNIDLGSPDLGGDYTFWRASAFWEQGFRVFRLHNFIYSAGGTFGHNLPIWLDPASGGPNLRGYLVQQFRGDSQLNAKVEYHFPLFSVGSLDFRALVFYDAAAVWFRQLPPPDPYNPGYYARPDGDMRTYNSLYIRQGLDLNRDLHSDVGAGLRFFLRSVAVPLIGIDVGYGLESNKPRFILVVGA
jgi:outer membrane protein assembly factor BamA